MDDIDRAQAADELFRESSLARRGDRGAAPAQTSAAHCQDCGGEIPEARRLAAPGCTRCIDCQRILEMRNRT